MLGIACGRGDYFIGGFGDVGGGGVCEAVCGRKRYACGEYYQSSENESLFHRRWCNDLLLYTSTTPQR